MFISFSIVQMPSMHHIALLHPPGTPMEIMQYPSSGLHGAPSTGSGLHFEPSPEEVGEGERLVGLTEVVTGVLVAFPDLRCPEAGTVSRCDVPQEKLRDRMIVANRIDAVSFFIG